MIILRGVKKSYRTSKNGLHIVLNDVSADFPTGHNVGILGANGAGKSTLLRLLSGVEHPDRGMISRDCLVSFPLGFASAFHPDLTGRENVAFIARLYSANIANILEYVFDFADVGEYFDMPTRTYSSGMLSKLAFGVCLAIDFDVYLVDEITEVGDQKFRAKSLKAFQERADRSDVILVSHNPGTLRQYCTRGAVLHGGDLMFFDNLDEAIDAYELMMLRST